MPKLHKNCKENEFTGLIQHLDGIYLLFICNDASFFSMLFIFTKLVSHILKMFLEKNKSSINGY